MADLVDGLRLLDEPIEGRLVGAQLWLEDLESYPLADHRMRRRVDRAHRSFADLRVDRVLAYERAPGKLERLRPRYPAQERQRRRFGSRVLRISHRLHCSPWVPEPGYDVIDAAVGRGAVHGVVLQRARRGRAVP